ncbi:16S rRNA (adenine(1518)-N(6)/adenine(1519)-N(6))-dimethyltransferase RsmA [Agromyces intestinalis]|uniref:16S rRNA (adenine(1518)-N(6)/adenine(1519)-N(6))- dimethyltransferase RsmA n=1 Tax=Agromyces intestinalis TaxID=2592652 RepID=UPI00143DCE23|nr:16S rRNA (adenine(1518)-N(6)/adenine(1519)-N(6))-dimethyltransferase RsmA [Agromyces intestinalis]
MHRHEGDGAPARPRLLGPAEIRDLAQILGVTPTKKLGQNFVHDANTVRRIVQTAGVEAGETVLEIGPGLGSLTLGLLETGASVVAVEIDGRLAEQLPHTATLMQPGAALTVVHDDALRVTELPGEPPVRLVANLPYNVSVPVLLHLLEHVPSIESGIVMVQAEVGHRLAAGPGSKVYGAPSVKAAWYGDWRIAGQVSRLVFWPVPNVDSVLVGFSRRGAPGDPPGTEAERRATFEIVDAAFQQRRKMLRQALSGVLGGSAAEASAVLERAGVDPQARGEQLGVDDFLRIARALHTRLDRLGPRPVG